MYFFLKSTRHRRFFLTLTIMAVTMSTGQLTHSSSDLPTKIYPARPLASAVDKALLGTEAITECPTLPAPSSMSGVTDLNTVRSQMWIVNGTWWAAFSSGGVYFYKRSGNAFVKGSLIESGDGKPDTLWNGTHLFIMIYKSNSSASFRKYSYNASSQTFTQLSGFPVNLSLNSASSITFAQDSQGKLWAAYTGASLTKVIWSTNADHTLWNSAGYTLATGLPTSGEIAAIVAFGGNKIGVAWSNQGIGEDGFRYHDDLAPETNWSSKELIDCCRFSPGGVADDHMNIKAAPDGRIFLVAKDGNLNAAGSGNGNLHLYVRSVQGVWAPGVLVNPDPTAEPTRPALLLDLENNQVYIIYVDSSRDQSLFSRSAMDNPSFGPACLFINAKANNVTSTKQNLDSTTDLIAAGSINGQILSNIIDLLPANTSAPRIHNLLPGSTTEGGTSFMLTVNGTGFVDTAVVQWKGSARTTSFINAGQLMAEISAEDIVTAGTAAVTVLNPPSDGGVSNSMMFTIESAGPSPTPSPSATPTPSPSPTPTPSPSATPTPSPTATPTPSPTATPTPPPVQSTLSPVADARVRSGSPTSNYGSRTDLRARRSTSSSTHESYLKFDLRTLGSGTVANARLRLYGWLESGSNAISTGVHSVSNSSWSESGLTWNNRPAAATNPLATTTITSTTGRYYEWDLTTYINSERTAGRTTISIALKNPQTSSPEVLFNAKEASGNRPQLVVTMNAPVAITSSSSPLDGIAVAQSGLGQQSVLLSAGRTTLAGPARSTTDWQVPKASSSQLFVLNKFSRRVPNNSAGQVRRGKTSLAA